MDRIGLNQPFWSCQYYNMSTAHLVLSMPDFDYDFASSVGARGISTPLSIPDKSDLSLRTPRSGTCT